MTGQADDIPPPSGLPEGEEECFGSAPGHEDGKFSTIIFLPALKWRIYDQKNLSIIDGCSRPAPVRPCAGTGNYGFGQRSCGGRHRRRHHSGRRHYEGYDLRCGRQLFDQSRTGQCAGRIVHGLSVPHDQGGNANPDRRRAEREHTGYRRRDRRSVRYGKKGGFHRFGDRHQIGRHRQVAAVERSAGSGRKGRGRAADQHLRTAGRESDDPHPRFQFAQRRQRSALDRGRHALLGRPEQPQPE